MAGMATTKIKFPEEYTLEKSNQKIKKKLTQLNQIGLEKVTDFEGYTMTAGMFYLYLLKKYRSPCFLTETSGDFWEILGMNLNIREVYPADETARINSYLERLAKNLVKCINNDVNIIIIPVSLLYHYRNGETSGHANVLIYRKKFNHIEHFEPYGKISSLKYKKMNKSTELFIKLFVECVNVELFKKKVPAHQQSKITPIELIDANHVCPYLLGFQSYEEKSDISRNLEIEPTGYCSAWSMFFTELCLKNPDMTSSQIITSVFNSSLDKLSSKDYFRHIIRGYATFINEKISTYFNFLLDDGKITIAKIKRMSTQEHVILKDKIKIIINIEMLLIFNPNAIDDRLTELQHALKNNYNVNERLHIMLETDLLRKYKEHVGAFNSPMNTPQTPVAEPKLKIIKECPPGKELNLKTNNCVNVRPVKSARQLIHDKKDALVQELENKIKECPPGKELNPLTGRCISIKVNKSKNIKNAREPTPKEPTPKEPTPKEPTPKEPTPKEPTPKEPTLKLKACPPGKEINPKTGRCVAIKVNKSKTIKNAKNLMPKVPTPKVPTPKVPTPKEPTPKQPTPKEPTLKLKACPPGKEINPKTGRCVNIKTRKNKARS
jgi:hypothetical protein